MDTENKCWRKSWRYNLFQVYQWTKQVRY